MKIILTEDVKKLGKKGTILEVKDGYARNSLFPKGVAVEANSVNLNQRKLEQKAEDKRKQQEREQADSIKLQLDDKQITIKVKTGEGGKVFGSVTSKEIADTIKNSLGVTVDKKKVQLKDAIKTLGTQEVTVKLHQEVSAKVKVVVEAE